MIDIKSFLDKNHLPFNEIEVKDYPVMIKDLISKARTEVSDYKVTKNPSFESTIEPLETIGSDLGIVASLFYTLNSAECTEEVQTLAPEISQMLTEYSSEIMLSGEVFQRVKTCYENRSNENLTSEQITVLEKYYLDFTRNGALLNEEDKSKVKNIDTELSKLSLDFSRNVLQETNDFTLEVNDENALIELPLDVKAAAKALAEKKNVSGWIFTLQAPSFIPFLGYCTDRKLREKLYRAFRLRAFEGERENQSVVKRVLHLRRDRARILGFESHADFVLSRRMAKDAKNVFDFAEQIKGYAEKSALKETEELKKLMTEYYPGEDMMPWDTSYLSEKLKKQQLNFNEEDIRPYFELNKTIEGVFQVAKKLFGISFVKTDLPTYHDDVETFQVIDQESNHLGFFYLDLFVRETKKGGAWMNPMLSAGLCFDKVYRPHISVVCNFAPSTKENPTLLKLREVETLFHEFGHALHGVLAKSNYSKVAGTNVFWDFVELPSQLMENWVMEKECLDLFAKHFETGETIPNDLIEKIKKSSQFMQGRQTMRQLSFGNLDMKYHVSDPEEIKDLAEFEKKIIGEFDPLDIHSPGSMTTGFSHIFAGGYSAGYYSYKWAEVLDADAFEYFKEEGIFNQKVAGSYKKNILEKGGEEDPMVLYKRFRGREPRPEALMRRAGFIS